MPNMKSIGLKTKELQSYKFDVTILAGKASWDHFLSSEAPLVIETTSCYQKHLLSSTPPLVIDTTSCHPDYLLLSEAPLVIETTSCY